MTLRLHGLEAIAGLMGPIAAFGLHRKVGAQVDLVCTRYGGMRLQAPPDLVRIGWFVSQLEPSRQWSAGHGRRQHSRSGSSISGKHKPKSKRRRQRMRAAWHLAAVAGGAELLLRVRNVLDRLHANLRPVLGIASGPIRATMLGAEPA